MALRSTVLIAGALADGSARGTRADVVADAGRGAPGVRIATMGRHTRPTDPRPQHCSAPPEVPTPARNPHPFPRRAVRQHRAPTRAPERNAPFRVRRLS